MWMLFEPYSDKLIDKLILSYSRILREHGRGLSSIISLWWLSPRDAEYILTLKSLEPFQDIVNLEKSAKASLLYTLNKLRLL